MTRLPRRIEVLPMGEVMYLFEGDEEWKEQPRDSGRYGPTGLKVEYVVMGPDAPEIRVFDPNQPWVWTEAPYGWCPVAGEIRFEDGAIGYYRSRGDITIEVWPPGTEWRDRDGDGRLPKEEPALSISLEPVWRETDMPPMDPDYDEAAADILMKAWASSLVKP
jgi:hypothetical protein